jgi:hypothetical protein
MGPQRAGSSPWSSRYLRIPAGSGEFVPPDSVRRHKPKRPVKLMETSKTKQIDRPRIEARYDGRTMPNDGEHRTRV